jgi:hypothetical protein
MILYLGRLTKQRGSILSSYLKTVAYERLLFVFATSSQIIRIEWSRQRSYASRQLQDVLVDVQRMPGPHGAHRAACASL